MFHKLFSLGYYNGPEYPTLREARKNLSALLAEELAKAKRKSKTARKHKLGADNYSITLGSDPRSALWGQHGIISF